MKMRITIQTFDAGHGEGRAKTLYCDWNDIPLTMTPDRCAIWMLAKAQERFQPKVNQPKKHD